MKWYRLSAEQGVVFAQYFLGDSYRVGEGVIQDRVYAHMWCNIAAASGFESAVQKRDIVSGAMTAAQIEKAQELARECVKKDYKGC